MGRKRDVSFVDEFILRQAETDFKGIPDGKVSKKLLAIIAVGNQKTLIETADFFRVSRQRVSIWIKNYKEDGLSGLHDRPKGHRKKRLNDEQELEIQDWLSHSRDADGKPIHWTVDKVKAAIEERFGIKLCRTWVWVLMRSWGFRQKVPRPRHAKSDAEAQRVFKKNFEKK